MMIISRGQINLLYMVALRHVACRWHSSSLSAVANWMPDNDTCVFSISSCVFMSVFSCFCCYYKITVSVYISSWRSWLQRRCICLHGVNGLEDQGGRKGQKMTSDPSAQLLLSDQESTCFSELQVNALLGNKKDFFFIRRGLNLCCCSLTEWVADPFKAIGAQNNSVFICLVIFLLFKINISVYKRIVFNDIK